MTPGDYGSDTLSEMTEIHWLMDMLHSVDVGLIVIELDGAVRLWNSFIENHSGIPGGSARGQSLFALFPDLDRPWLEHAIESVRLLKSRVYSHWRTRPYLLRFRGYHPITGNAPHMYQNVTLMPLLSTHGEVSHICLLIYDVTEVATTEGELQRTNQELARMSQIDGLTTLYNRITWEGFLEQEFKRCRRYGRESALVMFDIDHFKRINDTYGHQAGDEAIRRLAATLRRQIRETDLAGRYGGEEFAVILTDTPIENGRIFCERLRSEVERITIEWEGHTIRYTISLGVAPLMPEHTTVLEWLKSADEALYRSKETGRNRTTVQGE